jgi:hypothetical protein
VCLPTGLLPGPACPTVVEEWFAAGTEPRSEERYWVRAPGGQLAVNPPPEARGWAADAGLLLATASPQAIRLVQPAEGALFVLSPELRDNRILLRATSPAAVEIRFQVDGFPAGGGSGDDVSVAWALQPGVHTVEARAVYADGSTGSVTSTFEVREQ